jgi:hypothetical protein
MPGFDPGAGLFAAREGYSVNVMVNVCFPGQFGDKHIFASRANVYQTAQKEQICTLISSNRQNGQSVALCL